MVPLRAGAHGVPTTFCWHFCQYHILVIILITRDIGNYNVLLIVATIFSICLCAKYKWWHTWQRVVIIVIFPSQLHRIRVSSVIHSYESSLHSCHFAKVCIALRFLSLFCQALFLQNGYGCILIYKVGVDYHSWDFGKNI